MKNILCTVLILVSYLLPAQDHPILVTSDWLKKNLNEPNLVVLQVGFLKYDFDSEHIPGAQFLWAASLAPDSPYGSFNAPDPDQATAVLQNLGVNKDSHLVLYHARNEVSITARMFLTLENLGLTGQVSYLNGGLEAWKKAGNEITANVLPVKKGNYKVKMGTILVDKDYVLNALKSPNRVVVDARMTRYYDGEPSGYPRNGHITGAANIPYTEMVDAENLFKPVEQLQPYFAQVAPKDKELVTYCFIGQTASVVYMAGRMLGYPIKLYDGSLQEWSRDESLPMEVTKK